MALKTQYFCKRLGDYVQPIRLTSRAQGGLTIITGLNCEYISANFCGQDGRVCKPYKKARKDARYDARKGEKISVLGKPLVKLDARVFAGPSAESSGVCPACYPHNLHRGR